MSGAADSNNEIGRRLRLIYELLDAHFGNLHWWPASSPFEVAVGAILTQNAAWRNVEKAIEGLRAENLLCPKSLLMLREEQLASLIRPVGYYNVKARRLKAFVRFLFDQHQGDLDDMFAGDLSLLRERLLRIDGIGEETADSILLYAGNKPVFVVDAYTRRILWRHNIAIERLSYRDVQKMFMAHLPVETVLYNQYHALLVNTGKHFCGKRSRCSSCPLQSLHDQAPVALEQRGHERRVPPSETTMLHG